MAKREYNEARKRANEKYNRANMRRVTIDLNKKTDADILEKLDSVPSKQGYIKSVIRADIAQDQNSAQHLDIDSEEPSN